MDKSRGIIPTYVTDDRLILAKASPTVRNTYEIRLALYFALKRNIAFTLLVRPNAVVDPNLATHLTKFGAEVVRDKVENFSVTFGAEDANGKELDTWVLGDQASWYEFLHSLTSAWLTKYLRLGREIDGDDLEVLAREVAAAEMAGTNVDGETLNSAIMNLVAAAQATSGRVFLQ